MENPKTPETASKASICFDKKYLVGIDLAREKIQGNSLRIPALKDVVLIALDQYFASIGITRATIEKKLSE